MLPRPRGWIPETTSQQTRIPDDAPPQAGLLPLALDLAVHGWPIFPLAPTSKQPLANCHGCRAPGPAHSIEDCPCLPAGRWCHGVRAATTDTQRLTSWWAQAPNAVPGVAAGPCRLVLIDIDTHGDQPPADLATGLLPGIDLTTEPVPPERWRDREFRDGRDTLTLLAHLRGGQHPWPGDPEHQPVVAATPSGGRHLWYQKPAGELRQAIGELAWQVDIKAGWSYGIAPGATTTSGTYQILSGDIAAPGRMPHWLAREVTRVAAHQPRRPVVTQLSQRDNPGSAPANYVTAVIDRGTARLERMSDVGNARSPRSPTTPAAYSPGPASTASTSPTASQRPGPPADCGTTSPNAS